MEQMIFAVITIFFALVGVADFCIGVQHFLRQTGTLSPAVLVVEIFPDGQDTEARLVQAADAVGQEAALRAVRLAVLCTGEGDNKTICQKFCADRGLPLAYSWTDISAK